MSTSEVYREVALRSIQQSNTLEVLCYVSLTEVHAAEHPSWVPRWDVATQAFTYSLPTFLFNASAGIIPKLYAYLGRLSS